MLSRPSVGSALAVAVSASISLTCSEGAGPDPNAVASVVVTPDTGSLDTGDSLQLTAVARSAAGTELTGKTFTWSTVESTLVTLRAGGLVRGRWPGIARVIASSEQRADTARLVVIARIDSLAVTPAPDTLRSLGEQLTLTVTGYIGSRPFDGGEYTWEPSDTAIVSLSAGVPTAHTRTVTARKNGSTVVRVQEARGAGDSAMVVVRQQAARLVALGGPPPAAYRACPLSANVVAVDARGRDVAGAVMQWRSSDTTLAKVDSSGLITPLKVGTDTISVTADTASLRFPLGIQAAPVMTLVLSTIGGGPAFTVGQAQFAVAQGRVGAVEALAPAQYHIASSDTNVAVVVPATAAVSPGSLFFSEAVKVIGRNVGEVTLSPTLCDVPAPSQTLRVTRPHLTRVQPLPSNARTDDPTSIQVYTQDSAGVTQFPAQPVTVLLTTTDSTVLRPDSSVRHLPAEMAGFWTNVSYLKPGSARLILADSAGLYVPDSSGLVEVAYPPLFLPADTLHLGMRQHAFPAWDPRFVFVDRVVSGSPLPVSLTSSDSAVAGITPGSAAIPVGNTAVPVDITSRDARGTATLTAQAERHSDARTVVVVGRPAILLSGNGGVLYPGDPGSIGVAAADSATQEERIAAEAVAVAVGSSDTTIVAIDSATITIPAGTVSAGSALRLKAPGTVTITATDPRAVPYSYSGASLSLTVDGRNLVVDSALSLGMDQSWGFGITINGPLPQGDLVHVTHRNPAAATLADTVATLITPSYASVLANGIAAGVDTVIASAAGFRPDTGIIVVGTGSSDVVTWPPFGLTVGETWPLRLDVLCPGGGGCLTTIDKTFTLTANGNIDFVQDGVPITNVTVTAAQGSSLQFYVRGLAAGTGTVTISAPNYASVTRSVSVTP